jgi:TIR domain
MFVSVAGTLTPYAEEQLLKLEEQGALSASTSQILRSLLTRRRQSSLPSVSDIAWQSDLSAQTIKRLDSLGGGPATSTIPESFASTFLSYGGPDEAFARRLYENLMVRGVTVFFFPESATPGQRLHRTMSDGIHEYDRALLLCSRNSLTRPGVLNELEQILAREAREGGTELLIPVLLDDFVLVGWSPDRPDLARQVRDRVAADFRSSESELEFIKQLKRLLKALRLPYDRTNG